MIGRKVLSWNIGWGGTQATEYSINDKTAQMLAYYKCTHNYNQKPAQQPGEAAIPFDTRTRQLIPLRITDTTSPPPQPSCVENIVKFLKADNYDFISLQEFPNGPSATYISSQLSPIYNEHVYNDGGASVATYYNKQKYSKIHNYNGSIEENGRPYTVLFLTENANNNNYIIINLHSKHWSTDLIMNKQRLSDILSKDMVGNNLLDQVPHAIITRDFYVIVCGDFNDHGSSNFWEGIQPFKNLTSGKNDILQKTIVKSQKIPPFTCCTGRDNLRRTPPNPTDNMYGDYILFNDRLDSKLVIPNSSEFEQNAMINPTSDHLPIIGYFYKNNRIIGPSNWIFSENTIITTSTGKKLILVFNKNNWNEIGYVGPQYLISGPTTNQYEYKLNINLNLRTIVTDTRPCADTTIKGAYLTTNDTIVMPFKGYFINPINNPNNNYIIRDFQDPNNYKLVNITDILSYLNLNTKNIYEKKYLKYKNKYLTTKNK